MQTEVIPIRGAPDTLHGAELYLQTVEQLSQQLEQAMEAIVARSLPAFEDSVCQQRRTCSELFALPTYVDKGSEFRYANSGVDADLEGRIHAAGHALQTLNKRYSALLVHTGDTMKLLARLLGGYRASTSAGSAADQVNLSTWSCEA